jgi:hypothetical protein
MRIWELHSIGLDGAIRSTPDGEADVLGLVFSEKAYLLAVRDFRPNELVALVREDGPQSAAEALALHFRAESVAQAGAGRGLVIARGHAPGPALRRSDEVREKEAAGKRL